MLLFCLMMGVSLSLSTEFVVGYIIMADPIAPVDSLFFPERAYCLASHFPGSRLLFFFFFLANFSRLRSRDAQWCRLTNSREECQSLMFSIFKFPLVASADRSGKRWYTVDVTNISWRRLSSSSFVFHQTMTKSYLGDVDYRAFFYQARPGRFFLAGQPLPSWPASRLWGFRLPQHVTGEPDDLKG